MDFKPFNEVVLPPEKGTGIKKPESDPEKTAIHPPLKVSRPREYQLFTDPIVVLDKDAPELETAPAQPEPEPKPERRRAPPQEKREAQPAGPQDYAIAYNGAIIGRYTSTRRVTHRKAFQNIARQMLASKSDFDISRMQIFKLVPVEIELPIDLGELTQDTFHWFSRDENSHLVPSL